MENILKELKRDLKEVETKLSLDIDDRDYVSELCGEKNVLKKYIKLIEDSLNIKNTDESKSDDILNIENSMKWWNTFNTYEKDSICFIYSGLLCNVRSHESLTGFEIEMLYNQINHIK